MIKYKTIVIDPPWHYGVWGKGSPKSELANRHSSAVPMPYVTMNLKQITSIPITSLSADNCELYLWVTQKYLPNAFDIIKQWGFKYCQTITWCKKPRGTGQGGVFCPTTEFLILARKGKMPIKKRIDSTWFLTKRPHNNHSQKPELFQDIIETVTDGPRLEMFARRERAGWDVFGNEVSNSITL